MSNLVTMRPENHEFSIGFKQFVGCCARYFGHSKIKIAEIGSYQGESTEMWAQAFPDAEIYAIDPWLPGYEEGDWASDSDMILAEKAFDERTSKYPNIIKNKMLSEEFFSKTDIKFDIIYVDTIHTYDGTKAAILESFPYLKNNGLMTGHDFHMSEVQKAVTENLGLPMLVFADTSWLFVMHPDYKMPDKSSLIKKESKMDYLVLTDGGTVFQSKDDVLEVYKTNFVDSGWIAYYYEDGQYYRAGSDCAWYPVDTLNIP